MLALLDISLTVVYNSSSNPTKLDLRFSSRS